MYKQVLSFSDPYMNAPGTLGFAPDYRAPIPWDSFGAFVTNPISSRARKPANNPAYIEYPGGFLMHTGLPNPGLRRCIKKYAHRWVNSNLPIIAHLMADGPEETGRMVQSLEEIENIAAVELGFAPQTDEAVILATIARCWGELALIVSIPAEQILSLGVKAIDLGAAAVSLGTPRGMLMLENGQQVTGRLSGEGLFPAALLAVRDAVQAGITVIGSGGVTSQEYADAMLAVGAKAVQFDASLWKGNLSLSAPTA